MPTPPGLDLVDRLIDHTFPTLHGWCTPEKAKRMARLVVDAGAGAQCVELGVFGGRGVIAMGLAVQHVWNGVGRVDGIDPFTKDAALEGTNGKANQDWWAALDYETILKSARDGLGKLGLNDVVRLVLARSQDVVGDYDDKSLSILHQDSNHSEEVSCYEVDTWTPKMKSRGFWVFDDTNWDSTKQAQENLITLHGFTKLEQHESWAVFRAP